MFIFERRRKIKTFNFAVKSSIEAKCDFFREYEGKRFQ
jgi:hypothetical protein